MPNPDASAFPVTDLCKPTGLTKREWMATMILAGMMSAPNLNTESEEHMALMAMDHADQLIDVLSRCGSRM